MSLSPQEYLLVQDLIQNQNSLLRALSLSVEEHQKTLHTLTSLLARFPAPKLRRVVLKKRSSYVQTSTVKREENAPLRKKIRIVFKTCKNSVKETLLEKEEQDTSVSIPSTSEEFDSMHLSPVESTSSTSDVLEEGLKEIYEFRRVNLMDDPEEKKSYMEKAVDSNIESSPLPLPESLPLEEITPSVVLKWTRDYRLTPEQRKTLLELIESPNVPVAFLQTAYLGMLRGDENIDDGPTLEPGSAPVEEEPDLDGPLGMLNNLSPEAVTEAVKEVCQSGSQPQDKKAASLQFLQRLSKSLGIDVTTNDLTNVVNDFFQQSSLGAEAGEREAAEAIRREVEWHEGGVYPPHVVLNEEAPSVFQGLSSPSVRKTLQQKVLKSKPVVAVIRPKEEEEFQPMEISPDIERTRRNSGVWKKKKKPKHSYRK